jgi:RimJ/RimL family protein N-acetyltransferase
MEGGQPIAWFADRLEARVVLAAVEDGALLGTAGFRTLEGPKDRHKGVLFGMYVRLSARRRGVGAALVEAILVHAAESVEQVQLTVGLANAPARRLYARLGFVEWGIERQALKHDGVYSDDSWMVKFLTAT